MIGTPLPGRATPAVRAALLSHGWEGGGSEAAAALEPWAHHLTDLAAGQVEALLRVVPKFGVDLLTGPDWALLAGTRSRLSALARSWTLPAELADVAVSLGEGLPADQPVSWRAGSTVLDLAGPVVLDALPAGTLELRPPYELGPALAEETGVLLVASDPGTALEQLGGALDAALAAGVDPDRIALDPAWRPGAPPLGRHRRFGRPLVCTSDDPAVALLARLDGAQLFRTGRPDLIRHALACTDHGA